MAADPIQSNIFNKASVSSGVIPPVTGDKKGVFNRLYSNDELCKENRYVGLASNNPFINNRYSNIYGNSNVSNTIGIA